MVLTENIDRIREAYYKRDSEDSKQAHDIKANDTAAYETHQSRGKFLKSAVYGGLDGTITTFSLVAGVVGASLSLGVVLILGFANLIADGISMAIGDYLSTKSETEYDVSERERETWEFRNYPKGEKQEMITIYTNKGYSVKDAEKIVSIMSTNESAFVDVMMVEELGIIKNEDSPMKNALVTFSSFLLFGLIPLLAYVIAIVFTLKFNLFIIACILTGITLFFLGAVRTIFTHRNWFVSGFEMLVVGGFAATVAYFIGRLLAGIV